MKRRRWHSAALGSLALVLTACVSGPEVRPGTTATTAPTDQAAAIIAPTAVPVPDTRLPVPAERNSELPRLAPTQPIWQYFQNHLGFAECARLTPASQRRLTAYRRQSGVLQAVLSQSLAEFALVAQQLEAAQLPAEFAFLPLVESHYRALASAGNRPAGIWQLMPTTARGLGTVVTAEFDARLDTDRASKAAIKLLIHLGQVFSGDWRLANMAFNAGEFRILRALRQQRRAGQARSASTLAVSPITHDHLAKLEALSCWALEQAAARQLPELANEQILVALPLAQPIRLDFLAHLSGIAAVRLRQINPAWQTPLGPAIDGLTVLLPASNVAAALAGLAQLEALPAIPWRSWQAQTIQQNGLEQELALDYPISKVQLAAIQQPALSRLPSDGTIRWLPARAPSPVAADRDNAETATSVRQANRHRVRAGDTLSDIARHYRLRLTDLLRWNQLHLGSVIKPGQPLILHGN